MKDNNILSWVTSAFTFLTAGLAQDITQLILLILGVLSTLVSLAYTVWKWYRKAHQDGKITEEEIDELVDNVHDKIGGDKDESSN